MQGNDAIAQGAIDAGLGFYAGYPITPASEIMHYLANVKEIKFIQPEDEIASVNLCMGASLAGLKSMTATSGPGFSLMQEGIGFGHMGRIPSVIVNVQRVGPSTGMPTLPSQGDILQTKNGSHGDYFPIVFYPNSVEELYKYTIEAFNASEQAKIPVILVRHFASTFISFTINLSESISKECFAFAFADFKSFCRGIADVFVENSSSRSAARSDFPRISPARSRTFLGDILK